MVGIVVVSHSRALARAAVALAEQMLQGRHVPIVIAAGLDEETLGTDAVQIYEALLQADQDGDGVVVLMDLGSAILSAELALELLEDDDARQRVLLCPAPLVEGLVVAAVTALNGAGRAEVAAEAGSALAGKQAQLAASTPPVLATSTPPVAGTPDANPADPAESSYPATEIGRFTVTPAHGLHARPAARLVQALQGLNATVSLRNLSTGSGWVPGASLSRLATLGALHGHEIEVSATGPQAAATLERLVALAQRNFDDPPATGPDPTPETHGPLPASPGIVIGPARPAPRTARFPNETAAEIGRTAASRSAGSNGSAGSNRSAASNGAADSNGSADSHGSVPEAAEAEKPADPAEGRRRLDSAVDAVRAQVQEIRSRVAAEVSETEAAIFDTHLALLADPELLEAARSRIAAGQAATSAWANAVSVAAAGYESLADPYLQARSADVRALGNQVSLHLLGADQSADQSWDQPNDEGQPGDEGRGILVAAELTPAEAATLDPERVAAVVLAFGTPDSHSAILIRTRGIPAVVGAGEAVLQIAAGTQLALDGSTGELAIDPSEALAAEFRARAVAAEARSVEELARASAPAVTRDGVRIAVGANIGSIEDARRAVTAGADLIGLVRTEFLFLDRAKAPDVEEQESVYRALAETVEGRRITLRTLDVGGDKTLPYLPQAREANPFLGVRGIRLALRHPELLADQLLAMVLLARDVPVSVLFPMMSTLDELVRTRRILDDAVQRAGPRTPPNLQVGIMIEVPAAALKAAAFAPHVDFLSVGTNDLTQYALAAERGNEAVSRLADGLDPGVLRLIEATCRGAGPDTTVAVCGELASDERAAAVLVGLGVRELSVTPRAVPRIKAAARALLLPEATALAASALEAPSADAVRQLLAAAP